MLRRREVLGEVGAGDEAADLLSLMNGLAAGAKARNAGLAAEATNFTHALGLAPSGSLRERAEKCCHRRTSPARRVLADPRRTSRNNVSLNLRPRLRERPGVRINLLPGFSRIVMNAPDIA
jgi:hypothetical protein